MNTTSVKSYEVRGSDLGLGDRATFFINNNVPLLDPQNTYLKMNVLVGTTEGLEVGFLANAVADANHQFAWLFNPEIGAEALIKELTISEKSSGKVIEQIFNFSSLARVIANYTDNSSMRNLKQLYQGADVVEQRDTNTLTNREQTVGTWAAGTSTYNKRVEVLIPFSVSGILNGKKPFPCAVSELRIDVLFEDQVFKVIQVGGQGTGGSITTGNATRESKDFQNVVAGVYTDSPTSDYLCYEADTSLPPGFNNAATTGVQLSVAGSAAGRVGTGDIDTNEKLNTTALCVGQEIELLLTGGWTTAIVGEMHKTGSNKLEITFGAAVDFTGNIIGDPLVRVKAPAADPVLTLSSLELVCGVIEPSPQQYQAMQTAVSGKGLVHSYQTYTDYAFNVSANALKVSNMFNCRLTMAKAILTYWENVSDNPVYYKDSIAPEVNSNINPKSYVYQLNSLLVPSSVVMLDKFVKNRSEPGGWNAVAVSELKSALEDGCGYKVRDLTECDSCLVMGRSLKRGNTHYNFAADQAQPRVQIDFVAQTKNLLIHNWVCHDKVFVMSSGGSQVLE